MTAGERLAAIVAEAMERQGCDDIVAGTYAPFAAAAVLDHLAAELGSGEVRRSVGRALADSQNPFAPQAWANYRAEWLRDADAALGAVRAALGVSEA